METKYFKNALSLVKPELLQLESEYFEIVQDGILHVFNTFYTSYSVCKEEIEGVLISKFGNLLGEQQEIELSIFFYLTIPSFENMIDFKLHKVDKWQVDPLKIKVYQNLMKELQAFRGNISKVIDPKFIKMID